MTNATRFIFTILLSYHLQAGGQTTDHWETVFHSDVEFSYFTSSEGVPPAGWRAPEFDDSAWRIGQGGIGYGDDDDLTVIESCISVCMRTSFQILDMNVITEAVLHMDYDDAFVAFLNGVEIARSSGLTETLPAYDEASSSNHEASLYTGGVPESFAISKEKLTPVLNEGLNILAVQVHNTNLSSSDLSSNIFFSVGLSTPDNHYSATPSWFEPPFIFESSSLPIIIIDTHGQSIPNEPKIEAGMKIIHHPDEDLNSIYDEPNEYDGMIGIEVRGATSSGYPQTPYALETRDSMGENNNVPLLGMPSENDWVLLSHYNEKTFARNPLTFKLFTDMGHYATRTRLCDVIINGEYRGIYLFGEKIKRDKNRIDIAKIFEHNNSGDSLSGGYIFKTEYYSSANTWKSDYSPYHHPSYSTHFAYYYPKYDEISTTQKLYLKSAVDQFQQIMHQDDFADHYKNYIDLPSFIDYFIISELSRNVDGYKKSRYLFKDHDSKGGLIHSGPVWDMDWAWKNIYDCEMFRQTDGSGWAYKVNDCMSNPSPGWMTRLLEDPVFRNHVKCRYTSLRETILSKNAINQAIDSIYTHVYDAQVNHYKRWKILGRGTGAPEVEPPAETYDQEVARLVKWIDTRLNWLDLNMPGSAENCRPVSFKEQEADLIFRMFPNPASSDLYIESDQQISSVEIIALSGRVVYSGVFSDWTCHLDVSSIQSGLYLVKTGTSGGVFKTSRLVIQ